MYTDKQFMHAHVDRWQLKSGGCLEQGRSLTLFSYYLFLAQTKKHKYTSGIVVDTLS